ncbi:hypothetical protein Tco_1105056 [Tanacetum coccineum]
MHFDSCAHFGYNCPPKDPIISKPEPCNQTINEIPQTLPSLDPSCYSLPHVSKPNFVDDPPNVFNLPPQPQFETYSCELCGNDSHYGYDCPSRVPLVYEPEPCYNQNFSDNYYPQNSPSFSQQYLCCAYCGGPHYDYQCQPINETYYEPHPSYDSSGFDQPQPSQDFVNRQGFLQALDKIQEELEEIKRDWRKKKEDKSIEEMMSEKRLIYDEIRVIKNDLGYKRFRGEKIDEKYKRDCEIKVEQLLQDYNGLSIEILKKERILREEESLAVSRRIQSICDDDNEYYIQTQEYLKKFSSKELDNSLSMGDEHLDTNPETESDEVIKSSVENLVPIPSEFEGISNNSCDVPNCDNDRINVESDLLESLINRDTSIVYSSKIDPFLEEFSGELAHIAPIPLGIFEADFDPNDGTSSDDDYFKDIEYVSLEEVNEVDQEEKEFDLEDILQIQDVVLRKRLLNINRLITNIESLKDNPTPNRVVNSPSPFPIPIVDSDSILEESDTSFSHSVNSLPEFETSSDHTEETRSASTTTHANYSLPEYDSFLIEIEPNHGRLINIDISNNPLLELSDFESFHFDLYDNPSSPLPPPEPPDDYLNF